MIIVALITGVVLKQETNICMKYIYMILIVHHIFEVSDVMTTLPSRTTLNFTNARLVTLAPVLRPERRLAPLSRGLHSGDDCFTVMVVFIQG